MFLGFPFQKLEANSLHELLAKNGQITDATITQSRVGLNSLAWIDLRKILRHAEDFQAVCTLLQSKVHCRPPSQDEVERFLGNKSPGTVRSVFAKYFVIANDQFPFVMYYHLKPLGNSLAWEPMVEQLTYARSKTEKEFP